LTKIMTATVVIEFMEKYGLTPDLTMIKILTSSTTPFLGGTSAELLPKDRLSVTELMYGMMLPSGNDAA
jgi:D-alanyl-D-alanine carboxypeptidase